ncbi:saccharopine dehydrogenase family protein [Pantoea sp. FN060301]|uniref:saccharopine dehydrogenase family protein n=1 Tax=Pantoea sp. FN060301 TaxID=3420380 RepID=UPI003D18360A
MKTLLIYGATGYTGRMIASQAKSAGLSIIIAGRNAQSLAALAAELDVGMRVFGLEDAAETARRLTGVGVVLNCAGPFAGTAKPLINAAIAQGIHYLDITAEINVYRLAESLDDAAAQAGSMLLPGVGWDVVPTDCLAVRLARQVQEPRRLRIALQVAGAMSRGSAVSAGEIIGAGLLERVNGSLVTKQNAEAGWFDFGEGPVACAPLSFGDLVTAWHSTGIPDIEMFVNVTGDAFPEGDLSLLPDGPTQAERDANRARAVAEVTGSDGCIYRAVIETVNGYTYTPLAAVEAARRVLKGDAFPGFQTPAIVFGTEFALSIPGTLLQTA